LEAFLMTVRRLTVVLAVLAVAVGITASSVFAGQSRTQLATVNVTAKDFKFLLSAKSAKAGKIKFVLKNTGNAPHDFKIGSKAPTARVTKGKSTSIVVTLKRGTYKYICTVPGHAALGMKGTFRVL